MPTKRQNDFMNEYAAIMGEIKLRITVVQKIALNNDRYPSLIIKEQCYLQFRLICELISIACLVAHGDIEEISKSKLQSAYAADYIANQLQKLHKDFYPKPFLRTEKDGIAHFVPLAAPHLDKDKLVALTHECGRVLHRGSIKKLLGKNNPIQINYPEIQSKLQEICYLLDIHHIRLVGGDLMLCIMHNGVDEAVQVAFAEPVPD